MPEPKHVDLTSRAEEVRERIQKEKTNIEKGYMALAQLLHEAWENSYFIRWHYESFREYCQKELGIQYRRAKYYVAIADAVKKLGVDWEEVEGIGWTKMRVLLPIFREEMEDHQGWMDLAKEYSVRELESMVKDQKQLGAEITSQGEEKVVTLKFNLTQEQANIIQSALEKAMEAVESDSSVLGLEQMAYDYVMRSDDDPSMMPLPNLLGWVERVYGVKLEIKGSQDLEDILQETE
jgi:hypothetical protein